MRFAHECRGRSEITGRLWEYLAKEGEIVNLIDFNSFLFCASFRNTFLSVGYA